MNFDKKTAIKIGGCLLYLVGMAVTALSNWVGEKDLEMMVDERIDKKLKEQQTDDENEEEDEES